jgi:hypothetical protein
VRGPNTTASSAPTMIRVYAVSSLSRRPTERCDLRSAPNCGAAPKRLVAGGSQPHWGPANVP